MDDSNAYAHLGTWLIGTEPGSPNPLGPISNYSFESKIVLIEAVISVDVLLHYNININLAIYYIHRIKVLRY